MRIRKARPGLFDAVLGVVPDEDLDDVVDVLGNGALWCARYLGDYAGALWTAISHFGDCDTLGAIVGSIVALAPGGPGIPEEWRQYREPLSTMLRLSTLG
jgi:ADP-ribosylglycohydrolase